MADTGEDKVVLNEQLNKQTNASNDNPFQKIMSDPDFWKLNDGLKEAVIKSAYDDRTDDREIGFLGKFFGKDSKRISLYIAWIICMTLLGIGFIYILIDPEYKVIDNLEFWKLIAPIITASLGYIFGKQE